MSQWRVLRWLVLPLGAVGIASGMDLARSPNPASALSAADWGAAGFGPSDYSAATRQISEQLQLGQERVANGPDQWLRQESLARAYMARSRFSVTYDDLAAANRLLASARAAAPENSGPLLSMAVHAMMSHRLQASEAALGVIDTWAVPPDPQDMAELLGLRGDAAFYRGDMASARNWYDRAGKVGGPAAVAFRRANFAKGQGDYDAAIQHLLQSAAAPKRATPFEHAHTALQIGAIEQGRGNYRQAARWFAVADRQFPGFWLIEAHRAQAQAVGGDLHGAIGAMRAIAREHPAAEVMDALAMLLRAAGQGAESRQWAGRAGAEWRRRLALAPEAAYGHALEHELVFGTPPRALDLARRNVAARPFGEARVMLASALAMNGRYADALNELDKAEASGWRSAPLYALKAQVCELTGKAAQADDARRAAMALNPQIFSPEAAFLWFAHG